MCTYVLLLIPGVPSLAAKAAGDYSSVLAAALADCQVIREYAAITTVLHIDAERGAIQQHPDDYQCCCTNQMQGIPPGLVLAPSAFSRKVKAVLMDTGAASAGSSISAANPGKASSSMTLKLPQAAD